MSEELIELRGSADQLRHENTNLRSEREVNKVRYRHPPFFFHTSADDSDFEQNVQNRLVEENAALSKERTHLADLMRNLQTMQNELERSGSESRRRLEEQVTRLENQACVLLSCSFVREVTRS